MRNLYQRLKPEHREKLDKISEIYPFTHEEIAKELAKTAFWTELKIGIVGTLFSHLGLVFSIQTLTDIFDEK